MFKSYSDYSDDMIKKNKSKRGKFIEKSITVGLFEFYFVGNSKHTTGIDQLRGVFEVWDPEDSIKTFMIEHLYISRTVMAGSRTVG